MVRKFGLSVLLILLVIAVNASAVEQKFSTSSLKRVMSLIKKGKVKTAEKLFKKLEEFGSDHAEVNAVGGYLYFKKRDYKQAEKYLLKAVELNPQDYTSMNTLGVIYARLGQPDRAFLYLNRAATGKKNNPYFYYNLGLVFYEIGNYEEAARALDKALKIKSDMTEAYFLKGLSLLYAGDMSGAEEIFRILTRGDTSSRVQGLTGLGAIAEKRGVFEEAERYYREALTLRPDDLWLRLVLANVLYQMGKYSEAKAQYVRIYNASRKKDREALKVAGIMLAASSLNAGDYPDYYRVASGSLWARIEKKEVFFDPFSLMVNAAVYRRQGLYSVAENILKNALKNPGKIKDLLYFEAGKTVFERAIKGLTLDRVGDFRRAAEYFQKAYIINPDIEEIPYYLALAKYYAGSLDKKGGQKDLFQAMSIFKNLLQTTYGLRALQFLTLANYQVGSCKDSLDSYVKYVNKSSAPVPDLAIVAGHCALKEGKLQQAMSFFEAYLRVRPNDEDVRRILDYVKQKISREYKAKKTTAPKKGKGSR